MGGLVLTLSGFGSCSASIHEICSSRLPQFEVQLGAAVASLQPWTGLPNRELASEMPPEIVSTNTMAQQDRDDWQRWAEKQLIESQRYIDSAMRELGDGPIRQILSDIANDLVAFHGYSGQGRADKMKTTLERIRERSEQARGLACAP